MGSRGHIMRTFFFFIIFNLTAAPFYILGYEQGVSETILFGLKLRETNREEFREAILKAGGKLLESNDVLDGYYSSELLEGSKTLAVVHLEEDGVQRVAGLEYVFPSNLDYEQVSRIREMVESKYGRYTKAKGNSRVGRVEYTWILSDGIWIEVWRDWPNTTTRLMFRDNRREPILKERHKRAVAQENLKKYQTQNDAF